MVNTRPMTQLTRHTRPRATRPHAHLPETPTRSSSFPCTSRAMDPTGTRPWTGLSACVCHRCVCSGGRKGVPRSVCLHKSLMLIQGAVLQGASSWVEKRKLWALLSWWRSPSWPVGLVMLFTPNNSAPELMGGELGYPSQNLLERTYGWPEEGVGSGEEDRNVSPAPTIHSPGTCYALGLIAWGTPFNRRGSQGSDIWRNCPNIPQHVRGGVRIQTEALLPP